MLRNTVIHRPPFSFICSLASSMSLVFQVLRGRPIRPDRLHGLRVPPVLEQGHDDALRRHQTGAYLPPQICLFLLLFVVVVCCCCCCLLLLLLFVVVVVVSLVLKSQHQKLQTRKSEQQDVDLMEKVLGALDSRSRKKG